MKKDPLIIKGEKEFTDHSNNAHPATVYAIDYIAYGCTVKNFLFNTNISKIRTDEFKKWVNDYCNAHPFSELCFLYLNNQFDLGANKMSDTHDPAIRPGYRYYDL